MWTVGWSKWIPWKVYSKMRIDVVSIFPEYLRPLELSLFGKAVDRGLVGLRVHDLRTHAHDRHRSVDDAPYGGGPGMVMSPQPWGEALDAVITSESTLIVPTPSGELFNQRQAEELSDRPHLVFACGRYEGIDARVAEHYRERAEVREISIGDYVLAGGEVAALVICEAVVRLLPGVLGNPESVADDSFSRSDDLVEGPVYTRPPVWRDLRVPDILLSGDHERIRHWREEQAQKRTLGRDR
jgi:tRNA (guanine37-N1)-methyltransferase